jgi:hypothetical protein
MDVNRLLLLEVVVLTLEVAMTLFHIINAGLGIL